jgi:hypothetical protein
MQRSKRMLMVIIVLGTTFLYSIGNPDTIIVTGKLIRVVGPGSETTGWAIHLDSTIKIDGKPVQSIEADHHTDRFDKLLNKRVKATGTLTFWSGIERGYWPVLDVSTIEEVKSK